MKRRELSRLAAALGSLGGKSRSDAKAAAARKNGRKPAGPGKRRGRPPKA